MRGDRAPSLGRYISGSGDPTEAHSDTDSQAERSEQQLTDMAVRQVRQTGLVTERMGVIHWLGIMLLLSLLLIDHRSPLIMIDVRNTALKKSSMLLLKVNCCDRHNIAD